MSGAPRGADELLAIADRVAWLFPPEGERLLRLADDYRRMAECLDGLVQLSRDVMRARESVG